MIAEWVERFPRSYAARLAQAKWFLAQGLLYRGGATFDRVSIRGRRGLQYFLELARGAATESLTMTEKPLLSWILLGEVYHVQGNRLTVQNIQQSQFPEWYVQGHICHPQSMLLRTRMLHTLRKEWGGSRDHMFHYIEGQRDQIPEQHLNQLWGEFHANLAHHLFHFQDQTEEALKAIDQAISYHSRFYYSKVFYLWFEQEEQAMLLLEERMNHDGMLLRHQTIGKASYVAEEAMSRNPAMSKMIFQYMVWRAEDGDLEALPVLGKALLDQPSLDPETPAYFWLERAIAEGAVQSGQLYAEYLRDQSKELPREKLRKVLLTADQGSDFCAYLVYRYFRWYQKAFQLSPLKRYHYLHLAADGGNEKACLRLGNMLKAGRLVLDAQGQLVPHYGKPDQESQEYGVYLLQRPQSSSDSPWYIRLLNSAIEKTESLSWWALHQEGASGKTEEPATPGGWRKWLRYWWVFFLVFSLLRLLGNLLS
ncbi:hypothetical protein [Deinococcus cellulosilyticus]|nr:hypothetical protein [Deinococcus cellulosilyticus]